MNNSPERQLAFRIWAKNIMKTRRGGHDIRTLGFMTESIAQAVESRTGTPPARLLAMSGKNVLHADSVKHQNDGIALTPEDFAQLPAMLLPPMPCCGIMSIRTCFTSLKPVTERQRLPSMRLMV